MPSRKVLVVDDSRAIRYSIRQILESIGLTVEEAEDGEKGLLACDLAPPDLVLLDVDMPVMDGMQFLKELRSETRFDRVIVIMCTTVTATATIEEALASGANEYIMKPFTVDILRDKIEMVGISL